MFLFVKNRETRKSGAEIDRISWDFRWSSSEYQEQAVNLPHDTS